MVDKEFGSSNFQSSNVISPRKTSFIYPNPDQEARIAKEYLHENFTDVPLKKLLFHRFLLLFGMVSIFAVGLLCRLLIPVSRPTSPSSFNVTTNASFPDEILSHSDSFSFS